MNSSENDSRAFSWAGYRALVQSFLDAGYDVRLFGELDPKKSHLILRHDVDFSMAAAVDIARIEADMGVRAHYYVLLRTEFYNLASPEDWDRLLEISELGHDLGLHFDASRYGSDLVSLERGAERECKVLETLVGRAVTSTSFHRPVEQLRGKEQDFAGRLHGYQSRFFNDIAYVSDSRGLFRYGHPLDHPAYADRKAMQLLTHPIWWQETEVADKMTILDNLLNDRAALLQQEAIANCIPYGDRVKGTCR